MLLHTPTLFLVNMVIAAALGICLGAVASPARRDGMTYWAMALAAQTLAYLLFSLRDEVSDWLSIVLANGLYLATFALFAEGLSEFQRRRPQRWLDWGPVALLLVAFSLLLPFLQLRIVLISLLMAFQCLRLLQLITSRMHDTPGRGQYFVATGFVLIMVVLLMRLAGIYTGNLDISSIGYSNPVHAGTLLLSAVILVLISFGLLLMTKERADELNQTLAMEDELTGLSNRRFIQNMLIKQLALSQRHRRPLVVLLIDLDHFKQINDSHGHLSGDKALREVATSIQQRLRAQDFAGRWGGEEFIIILPETDASGARIMAEELCQRVAQTPLESINGKPMTLTISIGLHALNASAEQKYEDMISAADRALYLAKQKGRNRVEQA